jgi:hypothetical protein
MNLSNKLINLLRPIAPQKFRNAGLKFYFNAWRNRDKFFITSHLRPKFAARVNVWPDELKQTPKCAIIIQGPLLRENNFTLETIRLYKKIFPGSDIIISTWDTEEKSYVKKIKAENIEVILNAEPEIPGPSHINYQLKSSSAGVKRAKELNAEYVLKTRTDQRIYGVNVLDYFCNLLKTFPPKAGYKQKERIIGVSMNTFKYRLYDLSDMVVFGKLEDMELFWSAAPDKRTYRPDPELTQGEFSRLRICEMYLTSEFLKNIGRELKWTLEDSWQAMADHFIVVDQVSLDLYWHKYKKHKEFRYLKYGAILNNREMSFLEWFNLYKGLSNKKSVPENALGRKFDDAVPRA